MVGRWLEGDWKHMLACVDDCLKIVGRLLESVAKVKQVSKGRSKGRSKRLAVEGQT
jgi:hypothetical protein